MPTRGLHSCTFCTLCTLPNSSFVRHDTKLLLGSGEIRVFGATGDAFAAPNLIYHYILEALALVLDWDGTRLSGALPAAYQSGERPKTMSSKSSSEAEFTIRCIYCLEKLESTWQAMEGGGLRLTTAIPFGGPPSW
jgi:hypothetical protein